MTNISKRKLQPRYQRELLQQLAHLIAVTNTHDADAFLTSLFTPVEQIMFMKRLAVIVLLQEGYSAYRIAQMLHMSESTVNDLRRRFEVGVFNPVVLMISHKTFDTQRFLRTLERLLQAGMPSRGKRRWKDVPGFGG